jgi:hypothetical protein
MTAIKHKRMFRKLFFFNSLSEFLTNIYLEYVDKSISLSVIPAVLKPESSRSTDAGCPINDFGHDKNKKDSLWTATIENHTGLSTN